MSEQKSEVTIYTTPSCGFCHKAKDYFKENKIKYKEIDVAADKEQARKMIEESGQMGVPVIKIDNEIIVGFDKPKIKKALKL